MNFDLFSALIQTIIAVLAFLISILEVKRACKAKEEEQLIEQIEFNMVQSISSMNFGEELKKLLDLDYIFDDEDMEKYGEKINDLLKEYLKFCKTLEEPYLQLLKDEKRFSLSYGFGRYINAFRDFLSFRDRLPQYRKPIEELCNINNIFDANRVVKRYVLAWVQRMAHLAEMYPGTTIREIEMLYEEQRRKDNPDFSLDMNATEQSIAAYFRTFMEVLSVTNQLKNRYYEFEPYLKEIKLKFKNYSKCEENE